MKKDQLDLFATPRELPDGFQCVEDFLSQREEQELAPHLSRLPFKEFEFIGGYLGKRRVVSFGWKYDFNQRHIEKVEDLPEYLVSLRGQAARFAGLAPRDLQQVLVTEYAPGAGIGWHKDKAIFGDVVGISLISDCMFRFRQRAGSGWKRASIKLPPRSAYLLRGPARRDWEHSIPPVAKLRYSITFRSINEVST